MNYLYYVHYLKTKKHIYWFYPCHNTDVKDILCFESMTFMYYLYFFPCHNTDVKDILCFESMTFMYYLYFFVINWIK